MLENDQVLLAHPTPRRGTLYSFFKGGVKNWLKI